MDTPLFVDNLTSSNYNMVSEDLVNEIRLAKTYIKIENLVSFYKEQFLTGKVIDGRVTDDAWDYPEPLLITHPIFNAFGCKSFVPIRANIATIAGKPGYVSIVLNCQWVDSRFKTEALKYKSKTNRYMPEKTVAWYNTIDQNPFEEKEIKAAETDPKKSKSLTQSILDNTGDFSKRNSSNLEATRIMTSLVAKNLTHMATAPVLMAYAIYRYKQTCDIALIAHSDAQESYENLVGSTIDKYAQIMSGFAMAHSTRISSLAVDYGDNTSSLSMAGGLVGSVVLAKYADPASIASAMKNANFIKAAGKGVIGTFAIIGVDVGMAAFEAVGYLKTEQAETVDAINKSSDTSIKVELTLENEGQFKGNFLNVEVFKRSDADLSMDSIFIPLNIPSLMAQYYVEFLSEIMLHYDDIPRLTREIEGWGNEAKDFIVGRKKVTAISIKQNEKVLHEQLKFTPEVLNHPQSNTGVYESKYLSRTYSKRVFIIPTTNNDNISSSLEADLINSKRKFEQKVPDINDFYKKNVNLNEAPNEEMLERVVAGIYGGIGYNAFSIVNTVIDIPIETIGYYMNKLTDSDLEYFRAAAFGNITLNLLHELSVLLIVFSKDKPGLKGNPDNLNDSILALLSQQVSILNETLGFDIHNMKDEDLKVLLKRVKILYLYYQI